MSDTNFSLLSQEEIDTLIEFLMETSDNVDSEVLSQQSIDKLIGMMRLYGKKLAEKHSEVQMVRAANSVLDTDEEWLLGFQVNAENGYMQLFATSGDKKEVITPRGYSGACFVDDESSWGYSITPAQFVDVAKVYNLKFSKDVYNAVCEHFAEKNFGDRAYDIDEFFLASSKDMMLCLV